MQAVHPPVPRIHELMQAGAPDRFRLPAVALMAALRVGDRGDRGYASRYGCRAMARRDEYHRGSKSAPVGFPVLLLAAQPRRAEP